MMATAAGSATPRQTWLRAEVADRSRLFFGLFLIATLNAFVGPAVREVEAVGAAAAAANLFGISAILWVALAAGLKILADDPVLRPLRRGDGLVAALVLAAALLPAAPASSAALTGAALWAIVTGGWGAPLRRAGIVFLTVTGALLWGRLILAIFSRPLLDIDAWFVAALLDAGHSGNMIWSAETGTRLIVAPGCSSMQGMSLALVFWATVNQYFEVRFGWRATGYCLAAIGATVAVNVLRIGAMLRWPEHLNAIHYGWGFQLSMWIALILVVAICLHGARREIFGRR